MIFEMINLTIVLTIVLFAAIAAWSFSVMETNQMILLTVKSQNMVLRINLIAVLMTMMIILITKDSQKATLSKIFLMMIAMMIQCALI